MDLQQRRAQSQFIRLLRDAEHVTKLDTRAWKVRYWAHHIGQSLQILVEEGKQTMFDKSFCRLVFDRVIVEDKIEAIVQNR